MGLLGGKAPQERHYEAPPNLVFQAMVVALSNSPKFSLETSNPLSLSCTFSTGVSFTSWGADMTASVIANGEASILRVSASAKFGFNMAWQGSKNSKDVDEFFDDVTQVLPQIMAQGR